MADVPTANTRAEIAAAVEAGIPVVDTQVVLGMTCTICGPIPWPIGAGIVLVDEARAWQRLHWLEKHGTLPPTTMDGQHR